MERPFVINRASSRPAARAAITGPLVAVAILAGALAGCDGAAAPSETSQIEVSLTVPGNGISVDLVTWTVLTAGGDVLSSGSADTSDPNALPRLLLNIPPGTGEQISLTAILSNGAVCSGISGPFKVASGQRVSVGVTVACSADGNGGLGSVSISTDLVPDDDCPVLAGWSISASPGQAASGRFDLTVTATDPDADRLTYTWTATAGTFVSAASPATTYLCQASGPQTAMVSLSDDHQPLPCTSLVRFPPIVCP